MDFNPKGLSKKEKEKFIEEGLEYLKTRKNYYGSEILSEYFYDKKDLSKALYWSNLGAEKGSGICMSILRWAYIGGRGVMENHVEGAKWAYLAAAKGSEKDIQILKIFSESTSVKTKSISLEGKKKAKEWMEKHPEAFFNPN